MLLLDTITDTIDWKKLALTDELTEVYNRRALDFHLKGLAVSNKTVSLAVIDIDFFKQINDTFGHSEGDRVLKEIAKNLQNMIFSLGCDNAIVSRFGGDEFVIVADIDPNVLGFLTLQAVHNSNNKASIGVAYGYPDKSLFEKADKAVYRAKSLGRNNFQIEV